MKFTIEYKNQKGGAEKNNNNVYYILCNDNKCKKITENIKNNHIKILEETKNAIDIININFHLEIATQWDDGDTYYPLINKEDVEHFKKIPELKRKNLVKKLEEIKEDIKMDNPGLVFSDKKKKLKRIDSLINFLNGTISSLNLIAVRSSKFFKGEPYDSLGLENITYKVKKE
jgi:hypothetical protein